MWILSYNESKIHYYGSNGEGWFTCKCKEVCVALSLVRLWLDYYQNCNVIYSSPSEKWCYRARLFVRIVMRD